MTFLESGCKGIRLIHSNLRVSFFLLSKAWDGSLIPSIRRLLPAPPSPFSLFQDDPSAPHKIQEALKSCLKEEESFNIQNSMSPKLEGGKGDQVDLEVNCLQNDLT